MATKNRSKAYYEPARWYDLRDFSRLRDLEFFTRMAAKYGPRVLECGSGTGRLAIPLAQAGFKVVGIDRDRDMVKRARAKWRKAKEDAKGSLRVTEGDITGFSVRERFDMAFVAFNVFLTLAEIEQREAMLRCVRRHLAPDGRIIIDVHQPSTTSLSGDQPERLDFALEDPETGCRVQRYSWSRRDRSKQQSLVTFEYRWTEPDGSYRREKSTFPMCVIFPVEMRLLLERAGYDVEDVYGDHDGSPFTKNSPLMIFVAKRRNRKTPRGRRAGEPAGER